MLYQHAAGDISSTYDQNKGAGDVCLWKGMQVRRIT